MHCTLSKRQPEQMPESPHYLHKPVHFILGKMHFQLLFLLTILLCLCRRYSLVEIKLELQKNMLKFSYGINYKYEGMLAHSFDRFYVITKSVLPTLDDLKLYPIRCDKDCQYVRDLNDKDDDRIKQNIKDLFFYCTKIRPYMSLYKMQITAHNLNAHKILKNEVDLIFPKFQTEQRNKGAIFDFWNNNFRILRFSFWRHLELSTS